MKQFGAALMKLDKELNETHAELTEDTRSDEDEEEGEEDNGNENDAPNE